MVGMIDRVRFECLHLTRAVLSPLVTIARPIRFSILWVICCFCSACSALLNWNQWAFGTHIPTDGLELMLLHSSIARLVNLLAVMRVWFGFLRGCFSLEIPCKPGVLIGSFGSLIVRPGFIKSHHGSCDLGVRPVAVLTFLWKCKVRTISHFLIERSLPQGDR